MEVLDFMVGVSVILEKSQPEWFWLSVQYVIFYQSKIRIPLNARNQPRHNRDSTGHSNLEVRCPNRYTTGPLCVRLRTPCINNIRLTSQARRAPTWVDSGRPGCRDVFKVDLTANGRKVAEESSSLIFRKKIQEF